VIPFGAGERIVFGEGPWAYVALKDFDKSMFIRIGWGPLSERSQRIVIAGMWIELVMGVTGRGVAKIPFGRIEAALNSPGVVDELERRVRDAPDDVHAAPAWQAPAALKDLVGWPPPDEGRNEPRQRRVAIKLPLKVDERSRPDEWYQKLASAYAYLSTFSRSPAQDIAKANDVPVTTVNRWVKEARRRGLLAPSRRSTGGRK
jgi:hypothetical protein